MLNHATFALKEPNREEEIISLVHEFFIMERLLLKQSESDEPLIGFIDKEETIKEFQIKGHESRETLLKYRLEFLKLLERAEVPFLTYKTYVSQILQQD